MGAVHAGLLQAIRKANPDIAIGYIGQRTNDPDGPLRLPASDGRRRRWSSAV